ncbi:37S ribosomal protein S9 [Xylaria palmicola]|nr:37S ribosomal protein S9 [Xylaria palmicola]
MSSLRYGIRCLRALSAPATKQWPALASTVHPPSPAPRRAFATTAPRRQGDGDLLSALESAAESADDSVITTFARPMPISPSYFSRLPHFNDSFIHVQELARKYARLPALHSSQVSRVAWKTKEQYRLAIGEHVKARDYAACIGLVKRLHQIHPDLMPEEVTAGIAPFKRAINIYDNRPKPIPIDKFGRSHGVGKRKSSVARAWVVEGTGEVLINGKPLHEAFGRVHDRESAIWGLKATERLDKYNVWAQVEGGGTTGQAEALALAISKALVVHEPPLKTPLRRAGCITRDPRAVERKKPGRVKARKSPAWVKR